MESGAFTVTEFCAWAKIGKTLTYELINSGDLPVVKIASKTLIRRQDAEALLEKYLKKAGDADKTAKVA
ncbi:helix-turn-helix domain-containing protein [Methylocystis sp. ATCC 49242]|uniref:helix-turn-helix domain-containing protein n=1 Tax=Methylocystis sp. ATCC 49242 TaxID=622637 RepID=UPI0001F86AB6|nr:helix-turn-helix domain-containing protein [Methylocystis sp. ATCC 49242]